MAQVSTSTTNFDRTVVALVSKRLEEELRAPLPHLLPGNFRKAAFVKGTNNTMRFIRVADLSVAAGTPTPGTPPWLTEGTPPTAEDLTIGYEEFSADQAGRVIKLTDKALLQNPFDLMMVAAEKVARNAIEVADLRVSEILNAGTNVLYPGTDAARLDVGAADVLTGALIKRAVANLKADNVPTFPDGTYHAIIHPGVVLDIQLDAADGGWIDANRYTGSTALMTGEIGKYAGVRFVESAKAGAFPATAGTTSGGTTLSGGNITAATSATTDIITSATAHGLVAGDRFRFRTLTGGAGLVVNTVYFVIAANLTATTFQLSETSGGTAINFTTDITAATGGKANDVYSTLFMGPESYAFGDWGTIETHITPPGGHDDPLKQSALVGWKGYFGAMLIDEAGPRYIRVETGSSL